MFWKFGVEWESVEVVQVDEQGRRISFWPPILVERGGPRGIGKSIMSNDISELGQLSEDLV
jgi:hypothetical protein